MSVLPLLLRIILAVVLITPGAGGCAIATAVVDATAAAPTADPPPCHAASVDDTADAPVAADPTAADHGSDRCGDGRCDCGCPCHALTALGTLGADIAATMPASPAPAARPVPPASTTPPPPTPPPIA